MNKIRGALVIMFAIVGAIFMLSANATVWVNRTVFDTDNFVSTVNNAIDDEEVQEALATRLSNTLIVQGDVQQRLSEALPENLRLLAPLLTRTARDLAHDIILRIIQNEQFQAVFDRALTLVHQQVIRILEGETAVVFEDDKVIIDLGEVLRQAAEELNVNADGLLARLDLPEDAGQIVLIEDAPTANAIQDLVSLHDQITWLVVGISVAAYALAVLIARDRRATLRTVGIVITVCGLAAMTILLPIEPIVAGFAQNEEAARIVFDALVEGYRLQSFLLVLLGIFVVLAATLLGESELARAVRGAVRKTPDAPSLATAIRSSAKTLRVVGFGTAALVLAAWPEPSDRVRITTFVLVGLYFIGLWIITGGSDWAQTLRRRISALWSGAVEGSPAAGRNDSLIGRNAKWLRLAGVVLAVLAAVVIPGLGIGALAAIVALTFLYLALIDWAATKPA